MNIRNINVGMSEYSSAKNWELLKSSCFVSEESFAFIAVIGAGSSITLSNDFMNREGVRVSDLNVDLIWKDRDNRMLRVDAVKNVKKINGEDRILACDCGGWNRGCDSEKIASVDVIVTDNKYRCWDKDDTFRWDMI